METRISQTHSLKVLELHQCLLVHQHRSFQLAVEGLLDAAVGGGAIQCDDGGGQLAGAAVSL